MASLVRASGVVVGGVVVALLGACGGDDDGPTAIEVTIDDPEGGLVDVQDVSCRREGDQIFADGIVRNRGDTPHYVTINVRFVDGDGVRVELTSDSVNDLVTGESAHWEVTVFTDDADTVVDCEVAATAS